MAVERANPVPPGVYWVDVIGGKRPAFSEWLTRQAARVKVLSSEAGEDRSWVLFRVLSPVRWDGPGFPTHGAEGMTSEDTVTRPPPVSGSSAMRWFVFGGLAAAAALYAWGDDGRASSGRRR